MLSVTNLDVAYGNAMALHGISIEVEQGQMVFVAGRNGAGKTTLFKSIAGFLKPRSGAILFEGKSIVGLPPEKVALLGIRYIFQDKRVFSNLTVRENIELAAYPVKVNMNEAVGKVLQ